MKDCKLCFVVVLFVCMGVGGGWGFDQYQCSHYKTDKSATNNIAIDSTKTVLDSICPLQSRVQLVTDSVNRLL